MRFGVGIARGVTIRPSTRGIGIEVQPRSPAGSNGDGRVVPGSAFGPLTVYRSARRTLAERVADWEHTFEGELRRLRHEDEAASIARHEDELVHAHLRCPGPAPPPSPPRPAPDPATLAATGPESVLRELELAFAHAGVPAAAVDCARNRLTVVVLAPAPDDIAAQAPGHTPTGRRKLKARTQAQRDRLYALALASRVLASARIAFAAGPSMREAVLVALRPPGEVLFLGKLGRGELEDVRWAEIDPVHLLAGLDRVRLALPGDGGLLPLDLADEPAVATLAREVGAALAG